MVPPGKYRVSTGSENRFRTERIQVGLHPNDIIASHDEDLFLLPMQTAMR
jgi:hypothetical protein